MPDAELAYIVEDMKANGYDPSMPVITYEGQILDGRNRFKAADLAGVDPSFVEYEGDDALAFVIRHNLHRRHLNESQRAVVASRLANMNPHRPSNKSANLHTSVTQPQAAEMLNVSTRTVATVKAVEREAPQLIPLIEAGQITANEAVKQVKKEKYRQERESLANIGASKTIDVDFRIGDFEQVFTDIPDGSVDCIITDPPYPYEFIECWTKLSRFAKRVLKPHGFCIAYSGQMHLPEVMNRMSEHLDYYWTFSLLHTGTKQLINGRSLFCGWKPILIFQNGFKKINNPFDDFINGSGMEKSHHRWQQSEIELNHLIENFTQPNDLIIEPFAGGGTTIIACLKANRNIKASEIDLETYNVTKTRIYDEQHKK